MRPFAVEIPARLAVLALLAAASPVRAQDPPPRIGPWALDVRGSVPRFPNDDPLLAASRGLDVRELPGAGLGLDLGAHVYPLKWKAITFGVGAQATLARATSSPPADVALLRPVTERFTTLAPQLSFNFGTGDGWSYISGGIGRATWSLVPDGSEPGTADQERLTTINYGGGARWFIKPHGKAGGSGSSRPTSAAPSSPPTSGGRSTDSTSAS
jgi:hypothetical protein